MTLTGGASHKGRNTKHRATVLATPETIAIATRYMNSFNSFSSINDAKSRELRQGNPQKFNSLALRGVQNQSLRLPFILAQIGLGPASVSDQRRHVFIGLVSSELWIRKEAHRPRSSPVRPALFQRRLKREQQLSRLGSCIDLAFLGYDEDPLVSVVNAHDFGGIITLATFLRRCLGGHSRHKQKRQSKSG